MIHSRPILLPASVLRLLRTTAAAWGVSLRAPALALPRAVWQ